MLGPKARSMVRIISEVASADTEALKDKWSSQVPANIYRHLTSSPRLQSAILSYVDIGIRADYYD